MPQEDQNTALIFGLPLSRQPFSGFGVLTVAAAENEQSDDNDPDDVVIVKNIAKAAVHKMILLNLI